MQIHAIEKQIDYKIPAVDVKMKTTGELKGNASQPFAKTIYDPVIWNDAKLEKALKETLQDSANKSNCTIPREWDGITAEGYTIRGYFENGKVTSFYFD